MISYYAFSQTQTYIYHQVVSHLYLLDLFAAHLVLRFHLLGNPWIELARCLLSHLNPLLGIELTDFHIVL